MADLDYKKRKYEGTACTRQKGKGRCLCDRCPSGSGIPASNLCDVKPILPLYDRSVAETVSAGKWTLDNYIQAFQNADLWKGMKNSFVYVVEVCILEIVLGGLAAYGLARAGGKISNALRTVNICIMMIPSLSLLVVLIL